MVIFPLLRIQHRHGTSQVHCDSLVLVLYAVEHVVSLTSHLELESKMARPLVVPSEARRVVDSDESHRVEFFHRWAVECVALWSSVVL